jgi:hypothetical protein
MAATAADMPSVSAESVEPETEPKQRELEKRVKVGNISARNLAKQADLLEQLRKQVENESLQVGNFRREFSDSFGQDFANLVDRFYPTQRSILRGMSKVMNGKGSTFGVPGMVETAEFINEAEGFDRSDINNQSSGTSQEIARRKEAEENKKMLLMIIDQKRDQNRLHRSSKTSHSRKLTLFY